MGLMYKRILLKVSGEMLSSNKTEQNPLSFIASSIKQLHEKNVQVALVVGGGNLVRGRDAGRANIQRTSADHAGLLGTMINGIYLKQALENFSLPAKILSSVCIPQMFETYTPELADQYLQKNQIVIFVAGLGACFFSTDTAAVVRGLEISAQILLKGTKVDGVYDKNPNLENANKYDRLDCSDLLQKELGVMDMSAAALLKENQLPIVVFDLFEPDAILKIVYKESVGTYIEGK